MSREAALLDVHPQPAPVAAVPWTGRCTRGESELVVGVAGVAGARRVVLRTLHPDGVVGRPLASKCHGHRLSHTHTHSGHISTEIITGAVASGSVQSVWIVFEVEVASHEHFEHGPIANRESVASATCSTSRQLQNAVA